MAENETWFGNKRVSPTHKRELVRNVFSSVASKYDIMNDLMSLGIHRLWKDSMVEWANPSHCRDILDVAGGTGDIAFRLLAKAPEAQITVCDLTPEMVAKGRDRAFDRGLLDGIHWTVGNAESLPFPPASMDLYTIAFGLRNVVHMESALKEAARILRPGGRFLCLEFSHMVHEPLKKLYDLYSFKILPRLGEYVAKDADSYLYLAESIRRFPTQEELSAHMRDAGFSLVKYRNLSGGIAAIHSGWRL